MTEARIFQASQKVEYLTYSSKLKAADFRGNVSKTFFTASSESRFSSFPRDTDLFPPITMSSHSKLICDQRVWTVMR